MTQIDDRATTAPTIPDISAEPRRLTGMEALVQVLVEQSRADRRRGLRTGGFASGYPGSPVAKLHDLLEKKKDTLADLGIHHRPGLNEELAATAVWGSQTVGGADDALVDGVFALWYGKAPGVDRAADALHHGNIRGSSRHGGVVLVAGDDPKPNATVYPSDSIPTLASWGVPILFPGTAQEVVDLGLHAYAISRASGLWTCLKMVTAVADGSGVVVDSDTDDAVVPTVEFDGAPFVPTLRRNEAGIGLVEAERDMAARHAVAAEYARVNGLNPIVVGSPADRIGIVAPGKTFHDLRSAFGRLGLDDAALGAEGIRVKKVAMLYPISPAEWIEFADGLESIIVIEEKRPFLEAALKDALYGRPDAPRIIGKSGTAAAVVPGHGELTARTIASGLRQVFADLGVVCPERTPMPRSHTPTLLPLSTSRTGFFCSGCPHSTGLKAPEEAKVGAGIGCHLLGLLVDRDEYGDIDGYTQMGGEGAQWIGMEPFVSTGHLIQNVGDGTFHHSASLSIRWAVASGAHMTFKILYNGTVGMTGGQDVSGGMGVPDLVRNLRSEGVETIVITTDDPSRYRKIRLARGVQVRPRREIVEIQRHLATVDGVSVLIHDQQCAADKRRRLKESGAQTTKRVAINDRVCEGCGDCNATSQCLSVQPKDTEFGRKTTIHQSSCNVDYSCLDGNCPSFLVVDTSKAERPPLESRRPPTVPAPATADVDRFAVHMTGIGGTGVVSVGAIVAQAATHEGKRSRTLDLTGSTIKAGPVTTQVQIYPAGTPEPTAAIDAGCADLVLAFDLLTTVTPENLATMAPDRTIVVGSTSVVPTAQMAIDPAVGYPSSDTLCSALDATSRAADNRYLDAQRLAEELTGNHMAGNALLLGVAVQTGALPLRPESVCSAIEHQGVAVRQTLDAFAWGRAIAHDRSLVDSTPGSQTPTTPIHPEVARLGLPSALTATVATRYTDLADYQSRVYATEYLGVIGRIAERDRQIPNTSWELTTTVAEQLHRLMAYKDEYEVARLHRLSSAREAVEREFGKGAKVSWSLHPPVLKSLGMNRKITVGPWFSVAFAGLASARSLRGTKLDPFGYTLMRRIERELVTDYLALIDALVVRMSPDRYDVVCRALASPSQVRGYEEVKLAGLVRYLEDRTLLVTEVGATLPDSDLVSLVAKAVHRC
ncbi:indolepyruvate ferredoxin oxidoreductase family protein [Gordonia sp. NPDC003376]